MSLGSSPDALGVDVFRAVRSSPVPLRASIVALTYAFASRCLALSSQTQPQPGPAHLPANQADGVAKRVHHLQHGGVVPVVL